MMAAAPVVMTTPSMVTAAAVMVAAYRHDSARRRHGRNRGAVRSTRRRPSLRRPDKRIRTNTSRGPASRPRTSNIAGRFRRIEPSRAAGADRAGAQKRSPIPQPGPSRREAMRRPAQPQGQEQVFATWARLPVAAIWREAAWMSGLLGKSASMGPER
jgi:hypothetical protein